MRGNEFLDKMELIDPAFIEEAASAPQIKKHNRFRKLGAVAACFLLLLSLGFGTYAYAAEVKEYNAAVEFFDDHDLSTEGLSRREIKKIYRDITTRSFSYSKTAEVIVNSISTDKIKGYEISQDDPTPEDLENIWNYKNYSPVYGITPDRTKNTVQYKYDIIDKKGEEGFDVFDKSVFEKYDGETFLWSAEIPEFQIWGYSEVSGGVIVYGDTARTSSLQPSYPWIAKLDGDGNILWKGQVSDEFHTADVSAVLENADGTYAVIVRGDLNFFCLSQYTADGRQLIFKKTEIGNYGIWNVAHFGDGYIVQLGSYNVGEYAKIVKVDREGNITESFSYSAPDAYYYISDMIEFNGKIYLSAYAVPKLEDEDKNAGGRYEIANVLNYIFDEKGYKNITNEKLTELMRQNYTAMLLVCDPSVGTPHEFYSVKGSIGGRLSLGEDGNLLWNAESITDTIFSPATSSFTIAATCYVFRYTFDGTGLLISQEKTGEITGFRR